MAGSDSILLLSQQSHLQKRTQSRVGVRFVSGFALPKGDGMVQLPKHRSSASLAWLVTTKRCHTTAREQCTDSEGEQSRNNSIRLQPFFQTDSMGTMRILFYFLVLALSLVDGAIMQQQLRGGTDRGPDADAGLRHLQTPNPLFPESYYVTQDPVVLGTPDTNAALGNPLKGLFGGTRWNPPPLLETVPFSLEWYNVAVSLHCFANRSWLSLNSLFAHWCSCLSCISWMRSCSVIMSLIGPCWMTCLQGRQVAKSTRLFHSTLTGPETAFASRTT